MSVERVKDGLSAAERGLSNFASSLSHAARRLERSSSFTFPGESATVWMELISSEIPIVRYEDVQGSTKSSSLLSSTGLADLSTRQNGLLQLCLTFTSHYRKLT
jgi:hypothetical protein